MNLQHLTSGGSDLILCTFFLRVESNQNTKDQFDGFLMCLLLLSFLVLYFPLQLSFDCVADNKVSEECIDDAVILSFVDSGTKLPSLSRTQFYVGWNSLRRTFKSPETILSSLLAQSIISTLTLKF